METKICLYKDSPITFSLSKNNGMMINATEMAKPFDRKVEAFMRNENTIAFINEALKSENAQVLNIFQQRDLYYSSPKAGTWMHRVLALKFAAWLSPAFELWVFSTIERILFGKHLERDNSFETTLRLMSEKDELAAKDEKTVEDFERYIEIERLLKQEKAKRTMLTRETVSGMKDLFK